MFRRCPLCRARLWRSPGKPDRLLLRTAETAFCRICDGELGEARGRARRHAELAPVREWLLAAPLFTDRLLVEARARFARRPAVGGKAGSAHRRERKVGTLAPWVDTLDLDGAASWLWRSTDGRTPSWPPAGDDARRRLAEAARHLDYRGAVVVDVGAVFGQRGLPFPPVPDGLRDERPGWRVTLDAGLGHLQDGRILADGRHRSLLGAAGLPVGHADVLVLELTVYRGTGYHAPPSVALGATGSVFRDADGRVLVLWR